jgi:hypothetical protein
VERATAGLLAEDVKLQGDGTIELSSGASIEV